MLPMPRQYGIGRRAPALRTLATSYDFKETWFIDVSSCTSRCLKEAGAEGPISSLEGVGNKA